MTEFTTSAEEKHTLFLELLQCRAMDSWSFETQNLDYIATLPESFAREGLTEGTVQDYEPHSYGIGNHDIVPSEETFDVFNDEEQTCCTIRICSCQQILCMLALEPKERIDSWREVLVPKVNASFSHGNVEVESPPEEESASLPTPSDCTAENTAERTAGAVVAIEDMTKIIVDCEQWKVCEEHAGKCLSSVFMALYLLFPKLEAMQINYLRWTGSHAFASFPIPQTLIAEDGCCNFLVSPLHTLMFFQCNLGSADVCYLADCCTEHKIFPNLRNIKLSSCSGMSYASITSYLGFAVNLDFDRLDWEGLVWPYNPTNTKNQYVHLKYTNWVG